MANTIPWLIPWLVAWISAAPGPSEMPARSADAFVNSVGVNVHLGYLDTPYGTGWERIVRPAILDLGVRHLRDAGTVLGDDAWMGSVYGRMQELARRGIRFDLVMRPAEGSANYSAMDHFPRLMRFAHGAVESFEGLNEPDLSNRPQWVSETRAFQGALVSAVRADTLTRTMPVYGPSMGQPIHAMALGTLEPLLSAGNIHPYPGGRLPLAGLAEHQQLSRAISGQRPWVVTETGYHNALGSKSGHRPVPEAAAGRYIPRLFLDLFMAGISRSYLYELVDEGTDKGNQEQNFGLLRHDGSRKPAFTALSNLLAIAADPGPSFQPRPLAVMLTGEPGIKSLLLGKRNGRYLLVLWQDVESFDLRQQQLLTVAPREVTIRLGRPQSITIFHPNTSVTGASSPGLQDSVRVAVTDVPVIVEIKS